MVLSNKVKKKVKTMENTCTIVCSQCGKKFEGDEFGESHSFDAHNCPNIPMPKDGESWEDYKARCEAIN